MLAVALPAASSNTASSMNESRNPVMLTPSSGGIATRPRTSFCQSRARAERPRIAATQIAAYTNHHTGRNGGTVPPRHSNRRTSAQTTAPSR